AAAPAKVTKVQKRCIPRFGSASMEELNCQTCTTSIACGRASLATKQGFDIQQITGLAIFSCCWISLASKSANCPPKDHPIKTSNELACLTFSAKRLSTLGSKISHTST